MSEYPFTVICLERAKEVLDDTYRLINLPHAAYHNVGIAIAILQRAIGDLKENATRPPAKSKNDAVESWTNGWNPLPSPCQTNRKAGDDRFYDPSGVRLMTAEDLGLRLPIDDDGLIDFTFGQYDVMFEHRWGRIFTDAPYAFWLGAEAA